MTSVPEAKAKAKLEQKLVLLDFTGSDWCGWCKKLHSETFSKPEFIDYAKKNLVLVEVDFPHEKPQSDALKAANQALGAKYDVSGYPTLVLLKPDGKVVWKQVGYLEGGPSAMIAKLDEAKDKS
jgi:protein disulfide-isomerase